MAGTTSVWTGYVVVVCCPPKHRFVVIVTVVAAWSLLVLSKYLSTLRVTRKPQYAQFTLVSWTIRTIHGILQDATGSITNV